MRTPALKAMNGNLFGCTIALKQEPPLDDTDGWIKASVFSVVVQSVTLGEIQSKSKTV